MLSDVFSCTFSLVLFAHHSFNDTVGTEDYISMNVRMISEYELKWMWKETVWRESQVISQYLNG